MEQKSHFFSFSGKVTASKFWLSFFTSLVGCLCTLIIFGILVVWLFRGKVEDLSGVMYMVYIANSLVWFMHIVAMSRRRLRDAGFTAKSYLWLLLPGVGLFIFVVRRLCAYSAESK